MVKANVETRRDEYTFLGSGCNIRTHLLRAAARPRVYFIEIWARGGSREERTVRMRPGGKSNGESPFFETPNLSFEGRVRNVAPPLTACDGASRCQARQLDSSTDLDRPRQTNDRPRQSRPDTDQPIRMPPPFRCQKEQLACPCGGAIHERHCSFGLFVRALFDLNLLRIALRLHFLVLKPVAR